MNRQRAQKPHHKEKTKNLERKHLHPTETWILYSWTISTIVHTKKQGHFGLSGKECVCVWRGGGVISLKHSLKNYKLLKTGGGILKPTLWVKKLRPQI